MSDRIDDLQRIVRLRERDMRHCEREVTIARHTLAQTESSAQTAEHDCRTADAACEKALGEQRRHPADPLIQIHSRSSMALAERAREHWVQAKAAVVQARSLLDELRRDWLKAQNRHEVLVAELERALTRLRRQLERRADRDLGHAVPIGGLLP